MALSIERIILYSLFSFVILTDVINGERTRDKMYETFKGAVSCFRRLNGTHQFGCSSVRNGNVGVLHVVNTTEDLDWLVESALASPYMVVLQSNMFNRPVLKTLQRSGKVSGVLLTNATRPDGYSPEDSCPNRYSGLASCDAAEPFNPLGEGLVLEDWGFPIFHVDDDGYVADIEKCHTKYNSFDLESQHGRVLCSLEMDAYMFAAVDSQTCIRRSNMLNNLSPVRYCDPLGDLNIWSTLFPRSMNDSAHANDSILVVAARMDATSMFDYLVPGAVAPTAGIVTLLSTAEILHRMIPQEDAKDLKSNVLFLLLHGEAYDYIGSSRVLYDMKKSEFPAAVDHTLDDQPPLMHMADIKMMVELSQLSQRSLFWHDTPGHSTAKQVFVAELKSVATEQNLNLSPGSSSRLPPVSLQTFLKEDAQFPGLLIADHDKQFTNKFYHSIYDDSENLQYAYLNGSTIPVDSVQRTLSDLSDVLAKSLYKTITGKRYTGSVAANVTLVDELLHCYLDTMNCSVFNAATDKQPKPIPDKPAFNYVGVQTSTNVLTSLTSFTLALLTGTKVERKEDDCHPDSKNKVWGYNWMQGFPDSAGNGTGICVQHTVTLAPAVSPAFVETDYAWASGQYSTWTESVWVDTKVRMFLRPSPAQEAITLAVGVLVAVLAFVVVFFVSRKSHVLFADDRSAADL